MQLSSPILPCSVSEHSAAMKCRKNDPNSFSPSLSGCHKQPQPASLQFLLHIPHSVNEFTSTNNSHPVLSCHLLRLIFACLSGKEQPVPLSLGQCISYNCSPRLWTNSRMPLPPLKLTVRPVETSTAAASGINVPLTPNPASLTGVIWEQCPNLTSKPPPRSLCLGEPNLRWWVIMRFFMVKDLIKVYDGTKGKTERKLD